MSEQARIETAVETTIDNCEVLRARLAKYEDADGKALGVVVPVELLELIEQSWRVPNGFPKSVPEHVEQKISVGLAQLRSLLAAWHGADDSCEWCAGAGHDHYGVKCEHCQPADHSEDVRAMVGGWIKCVERMPECGKPVQAYYLNSHGKGRSIRAHHIKAWTVEVEPDDPDVECVEYSEQQEAYYLLEGWYELMDNWEQYSSIAVTEGVITQWAPLLPMP